MPADPLNGRVNSQRLRAPHRAPRDFFFGPGFEIDNYRLEIANAGNLLPHNLQDHVDKWLPTASCMTSWPTE